MGSNPTGGSGKLYCFGYLVTVGVRLILDSVSGDGLRLFRLIGDTPEFMREMSVAEQRYEAVRVVLADGETVTSVAERFGCRTRPVFETSSLGADVGAGEVTVRFGTSWDDYLRSHFIAADLARRAAVELFTDRTFCTDVTWTSETPMA